jgi:hypothetical protein
LRDDASSAMPARLGEMQQARFGRAGAAADARLIAIDVEHGHDLIMGLDRHQQLMPVAERRTQARAASTATPVKAPARRRQIDDASAFDQFGQRVARRPGQQES